VNHRLLAVISDTHGGSQFGLMCPTVRLPKEDIAGNIIGEWTPNPTAAQEYLWGLYSNNLCQIRDMANGSPITALHLGDITNGDKHPEGNISTRRADQILVAQANTRTMLDILKPKSFRLAMGTQAHNFGEGTAEIILCELLKTEYPEIDIATMYHSEADIDGIKVDYSHHGPPVGGRSWLEGNVAYLYTKSIMIRMLMAGKRPPDLLLRGHRHEACLATAHLFVNGLLYTTTLCVLPSFSMLSDYGHQATQSAGGIINGMAVWQIHDGKLDHTPITMFRTIDIRTKEIL
jgi:hypothetical protein